MYTYSYDYLISINNIVVHIMYTVCYEIKQYEYY